MPSNALPLHFKQTFWRWWDRIHATFSTLLIKFCQNDRMYNPESSSKSTFIVRPRKYKPNRCQISVDLQFSLVSTLNFDVIVSLRVVFSLKLNNWFCLDYSTWSRATCNVDAISSAITLLADQEHKASIF